RDRLDERRAPRAALFRRDAARQQAVPSARTRRDRVARLRRRLAARRTRLHRGRHRRVSRDARDGRALRAVGVRQPEVPDPEPRARRRVPAQDERGRVAVQRLADGDGRRDQGGARPRPGRLGPRHAVRFRAEDDLTRRQTISRGGAEAPRAIRGTVDRFRICPMFAASLLLASLLSAQPPAPGAPQATEHDYVIHTFTFASGETLPELRVHYRTYGTPRKDPQGIVRNAVLIMHGTGGTGAQFTGRGFAGELFGPGRVLDA